MNLGFRHRLLLLSVIFIALVDLAVGVVLEAQLRGSLERRIGAELERHAGVMAEALTREADAAAGPLAPENADPEAQTEAVEPMRARLDPLADRHGAAAQARVSVIGADGMLLADSELDQAGLAAADDHGTRPEVLEAREGRVGMARRHSATLGTDMLYVARLTPDGSGRVVRVSLPLSEIDAVLWQLRLTLLAAGGLALVAAAALAMLASRLLTRNLEAVVRGAREQAERLRQPVSPTDATSPGASSAASPVDSPAAVEEEPDEDLHSVDSLSRDLSRTVRLLSTERARFETVLETMQQAVLALDGARRITMINRAGRVLLGSTASVEGRPLLDFVRVPALQDLVDAAARGEVASMEFDYGVSPRRRIQAQATMSRQGGGIVIVMHDVTELRRLETVRKDFIANVSHELRTPVAVIQANAETLLAGAIHKPERATVFLDALARHAARLGRLVSDLLDISRIEAGRYTLEPTPVELVEQVERTMAELALQAEDKRTTLCSELNDELWVFVDGPALGQVLFNLISNAIKYTQPGGHVEVGAIVNEDAVQRPRLVRVEVRDDGPGIDPRHHRRVFERFYRVDAGRARDMGGTGLGLAIVKHLVEAMGGQVGVDARRPRGSTFWFTIPLADGARPEDASMEDDAHEEPSSADEPVDDERSIALR